MYSRSRDLAHWEYSEPEGAAEIRDFSAAFPDEYTYREIP